MASFQDIVNAIRSVPSDGLTYRSLITRPNNTTAYTANDIVGSTMKLENAVRKPGGSAYLHAAWVNGDQSAEVWQPALWIQKQPRQTIQLQDNAAFTKTFLMATGQEGLVTTQVLPALASPAGSSICRSVLENLVILLTADYGSRDLYLELQTLTAYTPVALSQYEVGLTLVQL